MKRNDRLIILGCIYLGIAIACCIAGMIALGNDRIDAGFVLMLTMIAMAIVTNWVLNCTNDKRKPVAWGERLKAGEDEE